VAPTRGRLTASMPAAGGKRRRAGATYLETHSIELQTHRASQTSVAWKVQDDTARAMEELAVEYDGHDRGEFGPAPVASTPLRQPLG
jgi:hypothetical protein